MDEMSICAMNTGCSGEGFEQAFFAVIVVGAILTVIFYVIFSWLMGRIFKKLGEKQWKAWVPVYNSWTFLVLGKQPGVWGILALIPIVNIVSAIFICIAAYHIGLQLGKKEWFVVLYILLGPIWFIWLAFDSAAVKTPETSQVVTPKPVVK